ncbi:MAG TPA: c-type cytochrome biogenesis protein CcmI [Pasteurellaceae bacterium]|nr:c-type cytochrome biogenesis protein CcmI [Pasteurellaceae bacterium]
MNFWLTIVLLTIIVAIICFYPLLRRQYSSSAINRDALNKAFYFDRLKEIERDEQQGLLENAEQLKVELQQVLLADIPEQLAGHQQEKTQYGKTWLLTGFLSLAIISVTVYSFVGAWHTESVLAETHEKLPHFYQRLQEEDSKPLSETEMQQFAIALRIELQKNPNDAKRWWLLGQIGVALYNNQLAHDSYAKAVKLEPDNPEYKLNYAQLLMLSGDPNDSRKGEELLKEVIRNDHTNMQALSLLAFRYFEAEEYKMAAVTWAMMLKLMSEEDPRRALIEKSIRSARDAQAEQDEEKHRQLVPQQ